MKRKLYGVVACCVLALSCQKPLDKMFPSDEQLNNEAGRSALAVTCPPTVLSGTINSNTSLSAGTAYLLRGNVVVDGATLTIPAGTVIMGEKSSNGALIIKPNAQISAIGTVTNPIIFTSDQAVNTRAAGDWFGVAILGNAPNNQSNSLSLTINSTPFTAGGASPTSSAGSFEYVQIHYAGAGGGSGSDVLTESALILGSVGSGMTVRGVQISHSSKDGLGIWGGNVGIKEVFSYKIKQSDFRMSQGFRGNVQSILSLKGDETTTAVTNYGIEITNYLIGSDNTPYTYPVISNASLLGGSYCAGGDPDFKDAIVIRDNGNAQIYNSVIEGFGQYGLVLRGSNVVARTSAGTDPLQFSHNSFYNVSGTPNPYNATFTSPHATWADANGCRANASGTMSNWILGSAGVSCQESGNQFSLTATGYYNASMCGDKCTTFPNLYINAATTDLDAPDYTMLSTFFDQPDYRGALQSSTDTWLKSSWIDFCTLTRDYCH